MRRALQIAFAGIVAVMVAMVGVGTYPLAWAGSVTCCCGEHSAEDACGCPTCPATDDKEEQVEEDRLRSCSGTYLVVTNPIVKVISAAGAAEGPVPTLERRTSHFDNHRVPSSIAPQPDGPDS